MAEESAVNGQGKGARGGRPRQYASQGAVEALMGRVSVLEVRPRVAGEAAPAPAGDDTDRRFVGDAIVALLPIIGAGDADLGPMASTVEALVIARDLILANLGSRRDARIKHLRENGYLGWAGISE